MSVPALFSFQDSAQASPPSGSSPDLLKLCFVSFLVPLCSLGTMGFSHTVWEKHTSFHVCLPPQSMSSLGTGIVFDSSLYFQGFYYRVISNRRWVEGGMMDGRCLLMWKLLGLGKGLCVGNSLWTKRTDWRQSWKTRALWTTIPLLWSPRSQILLDPRGPSVFLGKSALCVINGGQHFRLAQSAKV